MSRTDEDIARANEIFDELYEKRAKIIDKFDMTLAHLLAFVDCNTDIELNIHKTKITGKCSDIYDEFIATDYFVTNIKAKGGKLIVTALAPWDYNIDERQEDL